MTAEVRMYDLWNYMLAETCLLADSSDGVVQLTVTPEILSKAHEEAGEGIVTPREAEASLIASVSAVYDSKVLANREGLGALALSHSGDVPYAIAFLALTVLAAFHMRTDDDHIATAFYPRLADMLGCGLVGTYPAKFDGDQYIALWNGLDEWLIRNFGRRLAKPGSSSHRRFLAFPLAHVPLREVDIKRLPQFFDSHGYEPGMRPSNNRLAFDLVEGSGPWQQLTEAGRNALQDPGRRSLVVKQVAQVLEQWDGCRTDAAGNRIASIELWMDIKRRRPELHLLARRPSGFPETLRNGTYVFEASHEGWYEAVPLGQDDGPLLSQGLRVCTGLSPGGFNLRFQSYDAVPLTPSAECPGFVSDHALRADTTCAVLCKKAIADQVARHLEAVSGERVNARHDETLPAGWCLFTNVRPVDCKPPPPGLERLAVESDVGLVCEGALRLGQRWTWLEDSPARVRLVGSRTGLVARVDGREVVPDKDGYLPEESLAKRGEHVIEIGNRIRRKALVIQGTVHPDCQPWPRPDERRLPVALPEGGWFVVGSAPGEFQGVSVSVGGATVYPEFRASWAIQVGAGAGATAIHLHDDARDEARREPELRPNIKSASNGTPAARGSKSSVRAERAWAETIYQANVRRPMLGCGFGCSRSELATAWNQVAKQARTWKRRMKRRTA